MKDTFIPSKNFIVKKWFLIDAKNQKLGRLASQISKILTGKKSLIALVGIIALLIFSVILLGVFPRNAEKIELTGKKEKQKVYRNHSGQPGGMRIETLEKLRQRKPEKIIETAVRGMLPKGSLGRRIFTNLKVYKNEKHPHEAQTPELINF